VSTGSGYKSLTEQWDGTSWTVKASPNPTGSNDTQLAGVSCSSPTNCFAVGHSGSLSASTAKPLVERWNGTTWSIVSSPAPSGDTYSVLRGVSCSSGTRCFAVGSASSTDSPLVERWNGSSWSIVATSPIAGTSLSLGSVSCASAASCVAVGWFYDGTGNTLIERWNGSTWSQVSSPNPAGATNPLLSGVSCSAITSCTAVGSSASGSTTKTLVEQWNGGGWSIVASPNPAGSYRSLLSGVFCTSATRCQAVGEYSTLGRSYTLIERYI
jgi:hypothetical protein